MTLHPLRSKLFPYTTLFRSHRGGGVRAGGFRSAKWQSSVGLQRAATNEQREWRVGGYADTSAVLPGQPVERRDRKSTRLNSSHSSNSYAVLCLKKKKTNRRF